MKKVIQEAAWFRKTGGTSTEEQPILRLFGLLGSDLHLMEKITWALRILCLTHVGTNARPRSQQLLCDDPATSTIQIICEIQDIDSEIKRPLLNSALTHRPVRRLGFTDGPGQKSLIISSQVVHLDLLICSFAHLLICSTIRPFNTAFVHSVTSTCT